MCFFMGGIKDLMGLLFLMDNAKENALGNAIKGKRKIPKEKSDILKSLNGDKAEFSSVLDAKKMTSND